jgi:membrane associated rhomboid family serine protease
MFLWMIVGVMAAIELVLSLSSSGIIGTDNLRWPAFMLGAFWQPVLSGALPPVYPGQTALMFITHAFLHGGFMHLAMNGVILSSRSILGPPKRCWCCFSRLSGARHASD